MTSPDASTSAIVSKIELMQTPRRPRVRHASRDMDADAAAAAAPEEARAVNGKSVDTYSKPREPAPQIPPTPASLPQKVKTKEQRSMERERFNGAMRGIQATSQAIPQAAGSSHGNGSDHGRSGR